MDKFQPTKITKEKEAETEQRVVKVEAGNKMSVQEFSVKKIAKPGDHTYATLKSKYGPLASTDPDRPRAATGARFSLNPLVKEPLSIEEEERRIIDEKVKVHVAAQSKQAKDAATQVGYKEGLKKGHEEAFKQFQQEGQERLKKLDQFLEQCEKAKEEVFLANERFLIELVFRIGKAIALKDLSVDNQYVLRLAKELIEKVGVRENITIRVNEEDYKSASMLREGLEKSFGILRNLNIEASERVKGGGCLVETEWHAIDASVETQLNSILNSLLTKAKTEEGSEQEEDKKT